jgi:MFS family permease
LFRPYIEAVRTQGAILLLIASFIGGGLPIGMLTLAVLLLARFQSGSFLTAGIMAAALSAGNAVGVAVQGALIDRRGQTVVLVPASLVCLSSLVALVIVTAHGGPRALTASLAVAGGAAIPATPSSMRVLWAALVADPQLRMTAYALSAVSFTAATILGPMVVSGLLLLGGPRLAVLVAAGLAGGGGILFAVTPASRRWAPAAARAPQRPHGLPGRGMRTLIAGNLAIGLAAGLSGVAVPAAAIALGAAALAGVFSAAGAAGDLCGGLVYGGRRWRPPLASRLVAAQCGSAIVGVGLALASGSVPGMVLVMPVSGAAGAIQGITTTTLLDDVAEPGMLTGSYALLVSCGLAGSAAGYAVGGTLVSAAGIGGTFLMAAAVALAAAGWYARRLRTLEPRPGRG